MVHSISNIKTFMASMRYKNILFCRCLESTLLLVTPKKTLCPPLYSILPNTSHSHTDLQMISERHKGHFHAPLGMAEDLNKETTDELQTKRPFFNVEDEGNKASKIDELLEENELHS